MKRFNGLLAIPAIVAAGACAPAADAGAGSAQFTGSGAHSACWIEFHESAGQVLLEAYAAPGLEGSYALEVRQASSGGDAMISQSGAFSSGPDAPERISQVTLGGNAPQRGLSLSEMMASMRDAEPGTTIISSGGSGVYDVHLRLMGRDGRQICAVERSGP